MTESPTQSPQPQTTPQSTPPPQGEIPVEIVSNEEMALIEAALAATRSALSSSSSTSSISPTPLHQNARSIKSITLLSKRKLSVCPSVEDIEDSGLVNVKSSETKMKKNLVVRQSLLHRFRRIRGLSVTDIISTEWCEKKMEFSLLFGKREKTEAMRVGSLRHAALEEEVIKKVKIEVKVREDVWALKFLNFIIGANQLIFHGLTRELPLIGLIEGVWITGVIDEIRMPMTESERFATLIDTKTRVRARLPAEPQQRNGRLQLMCYKHLWDTLVADKFPSARFFHFFSLNPNWILSKEIRENTAKSGYPAGTLSDLVRYYRDICCMLPRAHSQLLLRYELQDNKSMLGEDQFAYNPEWLQDQIKCCLEFWAEDRAARYTPKEERWKCRFCKFESVCPATTESNSTES